tara:strand:+ start:1834 stop:2580 length:747 start_codon:yes stop_codon:yes gene_type:complete
MLVIISTCGFSQVSVVEFFDQFYSKNSSTLLTIYEDDYKLFCKDKQIDIDNDHNKYVFHKLFFLHNAFTTTGAINGLRGGLLEIPYYDMSSRYKLEDVIIEDRTPVIFLSDLVSDTSKYKDMYTFGWCSEREMAFMALIKSMGFDGRIVADNGHAWSEVNVELYVNNQLNDYILYIDNTYDRFLIRTELYWYELTSNYHECRSYDYNCEICLMTKFYNPRSDEIIDTIMVSKDRIKSLSNQLVLNLNK